MKAAWVAAGLGALAAILLLRKTKDQPPGDGPREAREARVTAGAEAARPTTHLGK